MTPELHAAAAYLSLAAGAAATALWPTAAPAQRSPILTRPIPSSGEALPVVGLGTWITFNVGNDKVARDSCADVMRAFFAAGGTPDRFLAHVRLIAEGDRIRARRSSTRRSVFSADKVWISSAASGPPQIEASRQAWGVPRFDLLQVHNLLSWEPHLKTLFAMKAAGTLRYVGITTSEGRRAGEFERVMRAHPLDFIQVTYNILDREVEARILPLARERGMAVIVNRPFQEGALTRRLARHPLPAWAAEIDCTTWAQVLLKFIVSHPAVTCAIPATTRVDHVRENMAAATAACPTPRCAPA